MADAAPTGRTPEYNTDLTSHADADMAASAAADERELHIVRNAALVAGLFVLAAGMGLLRNMIIARQFGLGAELDAFYAAFKLPDLLFTIVAGGALATAFIPVFTQLVTEQDVTAAWRLASSITNLVVLVVSACAVLGAICAPWLVRVLIAPGFSVAQQAETATLMRLVLLSTIFFGISAVQSSALHSFKHFLLPALAPVVYPLGVILGAIWLVPRWGVAGLAVGAVLGALFHLLVKVPALLRYGFCWQPILEWRNPAVRRVFLLMGPRILDLGIFHLTLLATTNLASRLQPGSVSALEWGWEFMQLPETVIGTAFGLVAFPTLADLASRHDMDGLRATLGDTLRIVLSLTAPATVGLILLGQPLLELVYQRGAFDAEATRAVYIALSFYALGLMGHAGLELAARVFFAMQDTITPLIVAALAGLAYIVTGVLLMNVMGHGGLALANSLITTAELLILLWLLRSRLDGIQGWQTFSALGRVGVACVAMTVAMWWVQTLPYSANAGAAFLLSGFAGLVVFVGVGWVVRVPILVELPALLGKRNLNSARAQVDP